MPGALSSEVWKPQSANGYKEGISFHLATGQFHLTQVISAFQYSKQPLTLVLSMSTLSVVLQADTLHPHQSQNKLQATQRRSGERHPPTHGCPDKQSHSAHSYGGVCAGEAGAKSPAQHFWETAASGRYECLQCTKSWLHQQLLTPAQEEKNNTWINLLLQLHAKGRALYWPRS